MSEISERASDDPARGRTHDPEEIDRPLTQVGDRPARSTKREVLQRIDALALEQERVVGRAQLLAAGLSARSILRWVDVGVLTKVGRSAYSVGGFPLTYRGRLWAAALSVPPAAVLDGECAAHLLDFGRVTGDDITFVMRGARPRPQPGIVVHQTRWLPDADIVSVGGLRCTATARTLMDRAAVLGDRKLDELLDHVVARRLYDGVALRRVIDERPRWPGGPRLLAAIARLDGTAESNRSFLERLLIRLITESGMPQPANNVMLVGEEVDAHWIGTRAVIEADGREHHQSPAQIAKDVAKWEKLERAGFVVMRVTYGQAAYEPERTMERVDRFRLANLAPPVPRRSR